METNDLFGAARQLSGTPWRVEESQFAGQPPVLEITLGFVRGSQFHCPHCHALSAVHDTVENVGGISFFSSTAASW